MVVKTNVSNREIFKSSFLKYRISNNLNRTPGDLVYKLQDKLVDDKPFARNLIISSLTLSQSLKDLMFKLVILTVHS